jgi:hypothetical protein
MSNTNHESHKKSSRVLEKLGQKISHLKEDIVDNIERRRQSHSTINSNQVNYTSRTSMADDSSVFEKKPPTPPAAHVRRPSGKKGGKKKHLHSIRERDIMLYSFTFTGSL